MGSNYDQPLIYLLGELGEITQFFCALTSLLYAAISSSVNLECSHCTYLIRLLQRLSAFIHLKNRDWHIAHVLSSLCKFQTHRSQVAWPKEYGSKTVIHNIALKNKQTKKTPVPIYIVSSILQLYLFLQTVLPMDACQSFKFYHSESELVVHCFN